MDARWGMAISFATATLALAPGCTLLEAYPELPRPVELCSNAIDDDGDGIIDCQGPPCRGTAVCIEEGLMRCTDGYDDDDDGRTDLEDAACWPVGVASIERCASVLGGERHSQFWSGHTEIGHAHGFHATAIVAVDVPDAPPFPAARSTAQLAGALVGLTASIEVYLPTPNDGSPDAGLTLSLFDATTYRDISYEVVIELNSHADGNVAASARLHAPSGDVPADDYFSGWAPLETWFIVDLRIEARGDEVWLVVSRRGATDALAMRVPSDFPEPRALAIGASAGVAGSMLVTDLPMVSEVDFARPGFERCDDAAAVGPTPPIGVFPGADTGAVSYEWMTAIAADAHGSLCSLVYEQGPSGPTLVAARSGSPTWTTAPVTATDLEHAVQLPTLLGPGVVDGAALAIDGDRAYAAVTTDAFPDMDTHDVRLFVGSSVDCTGWTERGRALLAAVPDRPFVVAPPVRYEVVAGEHRITMLTIASGDASPVRMELRTFRSASGEPGTFVADGTGDARLIEALDDEAPGRFESFDLPRIRAIGNDRIATVRRWHGQIELWVELTDGWTRVDGVTLAASGEEATFDADALVLGELIEDARAPTEWRGRLFYTGLYDVVGASDLAPAGFGPARIVFRAPGQTR